jgi:Flp pilus assembly protein TadG
MMKPGIRNGRCKNEQRGQIVLAFLGFFPIFIVCMFVVTDLARYFYLKNQVRITADSAALAAAGALDMRQAAENQVFVINDTWGRQRAEEVVMEMQGKISDDSWMTVGITYLDIQGSEVTVIVNGKGPTLFGGYIGISEFNTSAIAKARIAVGVDQEW